VRKKDWEKKKNTINKPTKGGGRPRPDVRALKKETLSGRAFSSRISFRSPTPQKPPPRLNPPKPNPTLLFSLSFLSSTVRFPHFVHSQTPGCPSSSGRATCGFSLGSLPPGVTERLCSPFQTSMESPPGPKDRSEQKHELRFGPSGTRMRSIKREQVGRNREKNRSVRGGGGIE